MRNRPKSVVFISANKYWPYRDTNKNWKIERGRNPLLPRFAKSKVLGLRKNVKGEGFPGFSFPSIFSSYTGQTRTKISFKCNAFAKIYLIFLIHFRANYTEWKQKTIFQSKFQFPIRQIFHETIAVTRGLTLLLHQHYETYRERGFEALLQQLNLE